MTNLNIFQTQAETFELLKIIVDLSNTAKDFMTGVYVKEDSEISNLYDVIKHLPYKKSVNGTIRVVESQIWTDNHSDMIEKALRENRVPYQMGEIELEGSISNHNPIQPELDLTDRVEVTYNPTEKITPTILDDNEKDIIAQKQDVEGRLGHGVL